MYTNSEYLVKMSDLCIEFEVEFKIIDFSQHMVIQMNIFISHNSKLLNNIYEKHLS